MRKRIPENWANTNLSAAVRSIRSGFSVNGDNHPRQGTRAGVLKLSSITSGIFQPYQNKSVKDSDIPFLRTPVRLGTILFARKNTPELVGASALVRSSEQNLYLSDLMWEISTKSAVNTNWLFHWLSSEIFRKELKPILSGSSRSMVNISKESFLKTWLPLPPMTEQSRLASFFNFYDNTISQRNRLLVLAKASFSSLLHRLIAIHQRPNYDRAGWQWAELGSTATIKSGGTPNRSISNFWGGSIPWISAKDLKKFEVSTSIDTLTERGAAEVNVVPAGTILLLVRGMGLFKDIPIGITTRALAFNQDVKALLPTADLNPRFLAYALRARRAVLMDKVDQAGHGTGRLATDFLETLPIAFPDKDEQARIVRVLDTAYLEIKLVEQVIERLRIQKQGLMQKLLTGEWRLDERFDDPALTPPEIPLSNVAPDNRREHAS